MWWPINDYSTEHTEVYITSWQWFHGPNIDVRMSTYTVLKNSSDLYVSLSITYSRPSESTTPKKNVIQIQYFFTEIYK